MNPPTMTMKDLPKGINDFIDELPSSSEEETPTGVSVTPEAKTPLGIDALVEQAHRIGLRHDYLLKIPLAVYISTFFEPQQPLWLLIIGNPSSNKTTIVELLERSEEMLRQLMSDLVAIYDGEYAKHSPSRGTVRYSSCFSHLGCVTPMALNKRQGYMSALGPRFLFLRLEPLSTKERNECLDMYFEVDDVHEKKELRKAVVAFCMAMKENLPHWKDIYLSPELRERLKQFANLMASARGLIKGSDESFVDEQGNQRTYREVSDVQKEEPFRAVKQLYKLGAALAVVSGRRVIEVEDLQGIMRVALSSMPVRRADVLQVFKMTRRCTVKEATEILGRANRSVRRHLDELVALGVLQTSKGGNDLAHVYSLVDEFADLFTWDAPVQETLLSGNMPFTA